MRIKNEDFYTYERCVQACMALERIAYAVRDFERWSESEMMRGVDVITSNSGSFKGIGKKKPKAKRNKKP